MKSKLFFFTVSFSVGSTFQALGLPAGWLVGALLTGMVWSFFVKKLIFRSEWFTLSLALVGVAIGFMVIPEEVWAYRTLLPAFLISMTLTLIGALVLGKLFERWASLGGNTAFFCCLPGGASEVIALSERYRADQQIVAAFHTARITLFVLAVPLLVGIGSEAPAVDVVRSDQSLLTNVGLLGIALILALFVFFLSRFLSFPGAPMFIAIALGFGVHQLALPAYTMPHYVIGIAQVLIGSVIGMRFDRETLRELKRVGGESTLVLFLYVLMSMGLALVFFLLTPLTFYTTLLAIVPAGAAEMASTAATLDLDATVVATLQMLRVLCLFLLLPLLVSWFAKKDATK